MECKTILKIVDFVEKQWFSNGNSYNCKAAAAVLHLKHNISNNPLEACCQKPYILNIKRPHRGNRLHINQSEYACVLYKINGFHKHNYAFLI